MKKLRFCSIFTKLRNPSIFTLTANACKTYNLNS